MFVVQLLLLLLVLHVVTEKWDECKAAGVVTVTIT